MIEHDNDCAIEDDSGNDSDFLSDEDEWEDDGSESCDAHETTIFEASIVIRNGLRFQMPQKKSKGKAKQGPNDLVLGGTYRHARNPDGSLISNLARQMKLEAERLAEERRSHEFLHSHAGGIASIDVAHSTGYLGPLFSTGNHQLPDPLRYHPGPATPPGTPPSLESQSPIPPPPAPPSTPSMPIIRRQLRFGSSASIQELLTPPMSPTTAVTSMATAIATLLSSSNPAATAIAILSGSSSRSSVAGSASTASSFSVPENGVIHIEQLKSSQKHVSYSSNHTVIDEYGEVRNPVPFNGAYGPRAGPVVKLGQQLLPASCPNAAPSSSTDGIIDGIPDTAGCRRLRRPLMRSASSDLLPGEITDSLREQILNENNSRYIFTVYGTRRFVEVPPGAPPVCNCRRHGSGRAPHGHKYPPARQVYFVDNYKEPESWTWANDYNSKGW
ncbi:hypothetical protein SEUCBS140593_002566 [Sporothrix eucalyptigena]|uniref:Uncharacterized protein n=1 Tax=Sporothrix eucalyptigena TaxID=1812306 RepID=A0ABP0B7M4_9PEZI